MDKSRLCRLTGRFLVVANVNGTFFLVVTNVKGTVLIVMNANGMPFWLSRMLTGRLFCLS